jgi:flagellar motility protein MotE (MotC chaperone)
MKGGADVSNKLTTDMNVELLAQVDEKCKKLRRTLETGREFLTEIEGQLKEWEGTRKTLQTLKSQ